jgi:hypothetical protein
MTWRDDVHSAVGRLLADHPNCAHTQDRRTIRGLRTVRVGQLDVAAAGAPVRFVAGPIHGDAGGRAGEVLDRMAALTSADLCLAPVSARTDGGNDVT